NLVQNAHHAMATHPANRVLTVRVWPSDRHAYVEVRDTGPGIPPEVLPRVFAPFFTTKPPGEGSGLGLSVSYGIVTELGGSLRAENVADGGASFIIELPLGEPTAGSFGRPAHCSWHSWWPAAGASARRCRALPPITASAGSRTQIRRTRPPARGRA